MEQVLTPVAMKAADAMSADKLLMPSLLLMENAGRSVIDEIERRYAPVRGARILVICGKGNNGGDGFAAARHALDRGAAVTVVMMEPEEELRGDPLTMARILSIRARPALTIERSFNGAALRRQTFAFIIDALFGTSYHGVVTGKYATAIAWMNRNSAVRIAVDIPSGLNASTGVVATMAVRADCTVTMAALKPGLFFGKGREHAGIVTVADISMPQQAIDACSSQIYRVGRGDVCRDLPVRPLTAHKYSVGKLVVAAGSRGLTGAALLCSQAAMRSGVGAVILCVPESEFAAVAKRTLEVMPFPVASTPEGTFALDAAYDLSQKIEWADVVLIGPGIAPHAETDIVVRGIIASVRGPIVIDAGGLAALADHLDVLVERRDSPTVITPHIGEFAKLCGVSASEIEQQKIEIARSFARDHGVVLVLKGAPTIVAAPDGSVYINSTGNAGMATAGSGDVLAGIIAALVAQGNDACSAARNGVYVHGTAGDLCKRTSTQYGMIASDLIDALPDAFTCCAAPASPDVAAARTRGARRRKA